MRLPSLENRLCIPLGLSPRLGNLDHGDAELRKSHFGPVSPLLRGRSPVACFRAGGFARIGPSVMVGPGL